MTKLTAEIFWIEQLNVLDQVNCPTFAIYLLDPIMQSKQLNWLHVSSLILHIWFFLNWIIWPKQALSRLDKKKKKEREMRFSFFSSAHDCSFQRDLRSLIKARSLWLRLAHSLTLWPLSVMFLYTIRAQGAVNARNQWSKINFEAYVKSSLTWTVQPAYPRIWAAQPRSSKGFENKILQIECILG